MSLPATNQLINAITRKYGISENQLVISKAGSSHNGGGTWMHRLIVVDFCQWLDIDLKLWCTEITPLGTLELAFMTGNSVKKDMRKYVEEKNLGCGSYRYVPTVKRMVSKAVEEAKSLGANGIISFEIKRVHDVKKNNSDMDTYYVTGIPVIYKK